MEKRIKPFWGPEKGIPKNLSFQDFGEVRVQLFGVNFYQSPLFLCVEGPNCSEILGKSSDVSLLLKDFFSPQILGGVKRTIVYRVHPSKTSFGGLRKWDRSGQCLFLLQKVTERRQTWGENVS